MSQPLRLALLLVLALLVSPLHAAEDRTYTAQVPDSQKKKDVTVAVWIPGTAAEVKGAILQAGYPGLAEREDYQAFARALDFALVAGELDRKSDMRSALERALKDVAKQSGHPEIEHVPFITGGFSAGGGQALKLAYSWPERTIAVFSNGNPGTGLTKKEEDWPKYQQTFREMNIPVITVNGSVDPFVDHKGGDFKVWADANYAKIQELQLPWTYALQWGKGHDYGETNVLAWPFAYQVMKARLPESYSLKDGPVQLRPYPVTSGTGGEAAYVGDLSTMGSRFPQIMPLEGDTWKGGGWEGQTWLPNAYIAHAWRAFVVKDSPVTLTVEAEGDNVKLTADAILRQLEAVPYPITFYDGDREIGRGETPGDRNTITIPAASLPPVAVLHAVVGQGDHRYQSRPVMWIKGHGQVR